MIAKVYIWVGMVFCILRQRPQNKKRNRGGYIGAHALLEHLKLLTRDPTRYRTYFPELELICPEVE